MSGISIDLREQPLAQLRAERTDQHDPGPDITLSDLKVAVNGREQAQNHTVIGKAAIDAYVASGNLFAQNLGTFNREVMAFAQAALENSIETARALAGASSLSEAVDLQTKHSQKCFDEFLAESAKLTELSVELANETIAPLQSNIKETVEKLIKPIAA